MISGVLYALLAGLMWGLIFVGPLIVPEYPAILQSTGRYLALGLANVVTLYDPSLILLSGERLRYDYLYAEEVLAEMLDLTLDTGRAAPEVEIRAWGDQVWARGAAAMALDHATGAVLAAEATA